MRIASMMVILVSLCAIIEGGAGIVAAWAREDNTVWVIPITHLWVLPVGVILVVFGILGLALTYVYEKRRLEYIVFE